MENKNQSVKHQEIDHIGEKQKNARYERNRKYYLKHTFESLRSTLLHNVKSKGRIPSMSTVGKYNLTPEELIREWRQFKENVSDVDPLKTMKFKVLIGNML